MAKFVIAGKANCPYYAKAELLGDELSLNLPDLRIHKIIIDPSEWNEWLSNVCQKNDWTHTKSPIIWRELLDRGGKGMLLGDANDFQEYALNYYGVKSKLKSDDLNKISTENERTFKIVQQEQKEVQATINPINLTISNPESPVFYFIINQILNENIFPKDIFIRLYSKKSSPNLEGICMEIQDMACSSLRNIKIVNDSVEAFTNCDFAILLDELEPIESEKEDDQEKYHNPYINLSKLLDAHARLNCKILVSPFYFRNEIYALVNLMSHNLKRLNPKKCLIGNSMCDEMMVKAVLAHRLQINPSYVSNVVIMGQSLSDSFYIDLSYAGVTDFDGAVWAKKGTHWLNLINMVADKQWLSKGFMNEIYLRENLVDAMLNRKSILLFAQSIVNLIKLWNIDNDTHTSIYSAIVYAKGNYSIKEDVFLSIPVKFENGSFFCINHYAISDSTESVLEEIVLDTKTRIEKKFDGEFYYKDGHEIKLVTPKVVF